MRNSAERVHYIREHRQPTDTTARLWALDQWRNFDVYRVPVDVLVLNTDNRRFRAERMWAEEQLGRVLDPENNPQDERSIESLLLDVSFRIDGSVIVGTPTAHYEALKNDWLRRRQESPLWIRPDGTVRNGNRRLAMIKRLQRDGGSVGLEWVDAVILSAEDIDELALLEMEQREQLTENFKVRYSDIDYLLALREAAEMRDIDWFDREKIEQVAGELQSMVEKSKGEVIRDIFAVKYMDLFLEDSEQPGQYHRLLRTLERFRDIGRMMMEVEDQYPLEADRILQVLFAAVRSGRPHQDIRLIRAMFKKDRNRFDKLTETITDAEQDWDMSDGLTLSSPSVATPLIDGNADDDNEVEEEGPGPEVANYPKTKVSTAIDVAIDGFSASRRDDLEQVLLEVCNRLEVLSERDRLREALAGEDAGQIRQHIETIVRWAEQYRSLFEADR